MTLWRRNGRRIMRDAMRRWMARKAQQDEQAGVEFGNKTDRDIDGQTKRSSTGATLSMLGEEVIHSGRMKAARREIIAEKATQRAKRSEAILQRMEERVSGLDFGESSDSSDGTDNDDEKEDSGELVPTTPHPSGLLEVLAGEAELRTSKLAASVRPEDAVAADAHPASVRTLEFEEAKNAVVHSLAETKGKLGFDDLLAADPPSGLRGVHGEQRALEKAELAAATKSRIERFAAQSGRREHDADKENEVAGQALPAGVGPGPLLVHGAARARERLHAAKETQGRLARYQAKRPAEKEPGSPEPEDLEAARRAPSPHTPPPPPPSPRA